MAKASHTPPHAAGLGASLPETAGRALQDYLGTLGGHEAANIYRLVLDAVELPMMETMMRHAGGNQSKAAQCLGINRATRRTRLKRHGLL